MRQLVLALLMALVLPAGATAAGEPVPKHAIVVTQDAPTFTVELASNRTTGFSWYLESLDEVLLTVVERAWQPPAGKVLGAPGRVSWTFRARPEAFAVPRVTRIRFLYLRPWEPETATKSVYTVVLSPVKDG